jgi:hypothetical protein
MTVEVFVWYKDDKGGVGHAAVSVNGNYCSFWPGGDGYGMKNAVMKDSVSSATNDYAGDCAAEGRGPNRKVVLEGLDEARMWQEWGQLQLKDYSFEKMNCSTVVAEMLKAGSGLKPDFELKARPGDYLPQGLLANMANKYASLTRKDKVWTPEYVAKFARDIRSQSLTTVQQHTHQQALTENPWAAAPEQPVRRNVGEKVRGYYTKPPRSTDNGQSQGHGPSRSNSR